MHPVEHFFYYSSVLPSVFLYASPFHFLWNGVHLLFSPAAGHSGWEDHLQANNFHYMHHRYFECNYAGPSSASLDVMFGTFTEKFKESPPAKARADAKASLRGLPALQDAVFLLLFFMCIVVWLGETQQRSVSSLRAVLVSLLIATGPILFPLLFAYVHS